MNSKYNKYNKYKSNGAVDWQEEQYDLIKSYGFEIVVDKQSNREKLVKYMDGRRVQKLFGSGKSTWRNLSAYFIYKMFTKMKYEFNTYDIIL